MIWMKIFLEMKILCILREAFKRKKKKKCGFNPPPPKCGPKQVPLKMILRCQNTFWEKIFFHQFPPENDLPTQKKLKILVSVVSSY